MDNLPELIEKARALRHKLGTLLSASEMDTINDFMDGSVERINTLTRAVEDLEAALQTNSAYIASTDAKIEHMRSLIPAEMQHLIDPLADDVDEVVHEEPELDLEDQVDENPEGA